MATRRRWALAASLVTLSLAAAACGSDKKSSSNTSGGTTATTAASGGSTATTAAGGGTATTAAGGATATSAAAAPAADCKAAADQPNKGKTVKVFSSIRAPEDALLMQAWSCFEKQTGITIEHEGSGSFEADLKVRVDGGNAPDLAFIPQPGLLATMASTGKAVPLSTLEDVAKNDYVAGFAELGTVNGKFYAPPLGANVKSFVWFSPAKFKEKGYTIPTTWDEMVTLSDKIVADGGKPWCVAAGSGDATGWPLTDWLEDAVLRFEGPDVYDQWYQHKIPFNDPKIVDALDKVGAIVKNDKYVYNGVQSIPSTTFQDGGLPLLDGSCFMYRQASFYGNQFPKGTDISENGAVWAFYLPVAKAGDKKVMLGGGEFITAFDSKPETLAVATYLASPQWSNDREPLGAYFTANKKQDISLIKNPLDLQFQKSILDSDVFRFDASDLMPSAVGSGTEWKELVNWVLGESTTDALKKIEDSWPK
jgi:alpha-glucoside transport system substrate-binding protein